MIDKWDSMYETSLCPRKDMVTRLKRQPTEWEKIFLTYTSDKGLLTRIHRMLKNSTPKDLMTQRRNGQMN
jgi:hypothetical protein